MHRILILTLSLILLSIMESFPEEIKDGTGPIAGNSITIAGFINIGSRKDSDINTELTKSLITYLKLHLSSSSITSYKDVENYAEKSGFWDADKLDINKALMISRFFKTGVLVTGEYTANDLDKSIIINASIYDVFQNRLIKHINYYGLTDINLLDTIDAIDDDITGLFTGKLKESGGNLIRVQNSSDSYDLYINRPTFTTNTFNNSGLVANTPDTGTISTGRSSSSSSSGIISNININSTNIPEITLISSNRMQSESNTINVFHYVKNIDCI